MSQNATLEAAAPSTVSIEPTVARPESLQFSHFGILNTGRQSRSSVATSATINVLVLCTLVLLSLAAKKVTDNRKSIVTLVEPIEIKPTPPKPIVAPKLPPPPKLEVQQPKIVVPEVKAPEPPPQVVHMTQPQPVIVPAAPRRVVAPPAPVAVNLAHPQAAAVPNHDTHPSAIALGRPDNPIAPSNRPATSAINLGQRGMQGMPASNTGSGPTRVSLGSGSPGGTQMNGNGTRAVAGVRLGVAGGTGTGNGNGTREVAAVRLGETAAPAAARPPAMAASTMRSAPKVLYKPHPEYTAEARALHLEGTVTVRLKVMASGAIEVLGVTSGLGHGLDQSAMNAVRGTRFQPAMDASGHPIDWEGVVNVVFQLND